MKRPASTMCVIMLIHWVLVFTLCPHALRSFRLSNFPWVSWTWLSVWLWLTVGKVATFSQADMSYPLALAQRQQAPGFQSSFLLSMEGPAWCCSLGIEVERLEWDREEGAGARERWRGHIWRDISFHGFRSSHFLLIIRMSGARPPAWCSWGERWDTKCRQRTESGTWSF